MIKTVNYYTYYSVDALSTMTESEKALMEEMKSLIKDQNKKICDQEAYIRELQQEMSDMHDRTYDC